MTRNGGSTRWTCCGPTPLGGLGPKDDAIDAELRAAIDGEGGSPERQSVSAPAGSCGPTSRPDNLVFQTCVFYSAYIPPVCGVVLSAAWVGTQTATRPAP